MLTIEKYFDALYNTLTTLSTTHLDAATGILDQAYQVDATIFVIGNGQSAATASAFALDLTKQTASTHRRRFRTLALTDNVAALTAWANDVRYDSVFTEQLRALMRPGDVIVAVSVSGNSPNVIDACGWARENGGKVIGLAGFEGGKLREVSNVCLVFKSQDFGHVETAHVAVMHYWVDVFRERLAG
ncbi:MAG: SIS domain-containing protein [bacterium]|nr:SIS domain-containing protein [bacterium]